MQLGMISTNAFSVPCSRSAPPEGGSNKQIVSLCFTTPTATSSPFPALKALYPPSSVDAGAKGMIISKKRVG